MAAKSWSISAAVSADVGSSMIEDARLLGQGLRHLDHLLVRRCRARARDASGSTADAEVGEEAAPRPSPRRRRRGRRSAPGSLPRKMFAARGERGHQVQLLVDGADAELLRVARALDVDGWPSTRISPESLACEPLRIFISVDLPAPFSPRRTCTSPGAHLEVHAVEGDHAGERLADSCMCSRSGGGVRAHGRARAAGAVEARTTRVGARTTRRGSSRSWSDALEQRAQGQLAHLQARLVDRGERDVAQGGQRRVVVADEGDVVGHLEPALLDRVEGADGGEVVGGEDGGGPRAAGRAAGGSP